MENVWQTVQYFPDNNESVFRTEKVPVHKQGMTGYPLNMKQNKVTIHHVSYQYV